MTHSGFGADGLGELTPELRQLALALLDRLEPVFRLTAAAVLTAGDGPGKCQQVWCPVCALAALAKGEQHPMLSLIADQSDAFLIALRAILAERAGETEQPEPPTDPSGSTAGDTDEPADPQDRPSPGRYQPIPVTFEE
ncbi:hypothetical protein [Mycobacterium sp. OTB74]|uniref:hypothetical protein n=1 Tax=Mycobacterium sp. OTB74 TaxID=1853452 RepID=UPI002477016D|nr:hypothetical protein [Mycobacterium sp. OTB74]MDH6245960.1 hypothetical protein [Mycobacterium sp. OTB74]